MPDEYVQAIRKHKIGMAVITIVFNFSECVFALPTNVLKQVESYLHFIKCRNIKGDTQQEILLVYTIHDRSLGIRCVSVTVCR